MFFDEYCTFEINEILKIDRKTSSHSTKKRNISTLSYRISGKSTFIYDDNEIITDTNTLLFIPKGVEYSQKTEGEEVIAVHLNLYKNFPCSMELFSDINTVQCSEIFKNLYYEWNRKNWGFCHRCTAMLYDLLADIVKYKCSEKNSVNSKISNSVIYLNKNYTDPYITIAEIAAQSHISEIYFRKLWYKLYDQTPGKFLTSLRIKYAKSLLADTDYSVSEVAKRAGFLDAKYFSTKFKKEIGLTPGEYRNGYFI